ncbi:hypothetical protein HK100_003539 [Physocladia obscura]|uniref:Uncharacterized protein n=1 Tax=Physocladia obscura TaxID=109957 RepID=A0AAD5STW0_9FUNG|nr:hypothetical protein HK100_003539 [Physocladia obscura]
MQQPAFVRPKPVSNIQKPTLSSTIGSHSNNTTSNASKINTPIQAQQLSNQIISNNINSNNNVNNFGTKNNVNNFGTNTNNAIVSNSSSTFNSNTPTKSTTSPTNTRPQQQQTQLVRTHLPQQGTATPTVALTPNNSINKKPQNILQIQSSIKPNLSNNNNASNNNNNNNNNINTNKSSSTQLPTRFPNPVESSSGSNNSGGNSGLSIKGPPPPQHQPPSVNWNSSGVHGGLLGGVGQPGKRPLVSESTTSNQPFLFAAGGIGNGSMNSGLPGMSRAIGSVSVGLSNGGNNGVGVAGVSYNYGNTNVKKQKM